MSKRFPKFSAGRVIFAVTAVIVVYFLASFALNRIQAQQLNDHESRLQAEIADLRERHERLQALEQYLNSDEYIEAIAREQLGLVKEGEVGFVAISTVPTPTPAPGAPRQDLWWEVLIR